MKRVIALIDHLYEDLELWYPKLRLEEEGASVKIAAPRAGETYLGKHGYPCKADLTLDAIQTEDFDGLLVPGGFSPDKLRRSEKVCDFVRKMDEEGKPIAFICHAGWLLISAKILKGRRATSVRAIKDDMENAGAIWSDEPLVVDQNLISSRTPKDLPLFAKAFVSKIVDRER